MNYRHHFHAGNFADVVKHALLVQLFRALQRKETGFLYLDTHAGRGAYPLAAAAKGDTRPRQPEHPGGIGRLWGRTDLPPALADYVDLVRSFDASGDAAAPHRYPGSARLARLLARPQDRLALCEWHPAECAALRSHFAGDRSVSIQQQDGYGALRAMLPPPERRALVLVDPAFEDPEAEWARILAALREGLQRLPAMVGAVWYPLTERARPDSFVAGLRALSPPILAAEVVVDPASPKMRGCGVAVLNPPWRFETEIRPVLKCLAKALAQAPGGGATQRWIAPRR